MVLSVLLQYMPACRTTISFVRRGFPPFVSDYQLHTMQEAVLRHPDWATALKKDLLLNGFGKVEMGLGLALAVGNQSAVGYNVCEVGLFDGANTRKVRGSPIKSAGFTCQPLSNCMVN